MLPIFHCELKRMPMKWFIGITLHLKVQIWPPVYKDIKENRFFIQKCKIHRKVMTLISSFTILNMKGCRVWWLALSPHSKSITCVPQCSLTHLTGQGIFSQITSFLSAKLLSSALSYCIYWGMLGLDGGYFVICVHCMYAAKHLQIRFVFTVAKDWLQIC